MSQATPSARTRRHPAGEDSKAPRGRAATPLHGLLPLLALLAVWQVAGSAGSPYFPAPSSWIPALLDLWSGDLLVPAVVATLRTFAVGLAVATVLGTAVGILVGVAGLVDRALNPTFEFSRAMPPAAMVPVATLLLGYDEVMKVTVVTLAAVWPVLLNTREAVRGLDPTLVDTGRTLRLTRLERLRKIIVPALVPSILLGVRVAAPITVVITLLVEILTQVNGVGALIADAARTFRPARVYGLIVVAGLISLVVNMLVSRLETSARRSRAG